MTIFFLFFWSSPPTPRTFRIIMAFSPKSLTIRRAELSDVKEMGPTFPRSFHPISEYMRTAMPDRPIVQTWWESIHSYSIASPNLSVYVVTAHKAGNQEESERGKEEIIALARWRVGGSPLPLGPTTRTVRSKSQSHRQLSTPSPRHQNPLHLLKPKPLIKRHNRPIRLHKHRHPLLIRFL